MAAKTSSLPMDKVKAKPESQAPTSLSSDPKSIGLLSAEDTATYSTFPLAELNVKLEDVRFAGVPAPPLILVIEPVPSS
ncbi:MAG: Uncharacterised protein [Polaribacter sejongensis]|nr:MAG: Uncharacterised protein [Polaribacter sejongensis]